MADAQRRKLFGFLNRKEDAPLAVDNGSDRLIDAAETFSTLRVEDIMVPRADIASVGDEATLAELMAQFQQTSHSRMPVYHDTLDEPIGMVHIKDLVTYLASFLSGDVPADLSERKILPEIKRPVLFVPPSMRADALLARMQARRLHMAIVVDEYGGTDGLVTLEDVVEPIVGDIEDEHDETEPEIKTLRDGWEAGARTPIDDFEELSGHQLFTDEEDEEVDTLGGLVFTLAGRVPERGEIIKHPGGCEFEVVDADPRRVKRLRIRFREPVSESAE